MLLTTSLRPAVAARPRRCREQCAVAASRPAPLRRPAARSVVSVSASLRSSEPLPSTSTASRAEEGRALATPPARAPPTLLSLLPRLRSVLLSLVIALALGLALAPGPAHAARSGGRMGGSSFRSSSFSSGSSFGGGSFGGSSLGPYRSSSTNVFVSPGGLARSSFFISPFGFGGFGYGGGSSLFTLLAFAMMAAVMIQTLRGGGAGDGGIELGGDKVAVVRLQVGLLGLARELQDDLDALAAKADTSTPQGLYTVLTETVLALLRAPQYCVYGASGTATRDGPQAAEAKFNELSLEERSKFESETLVNAGGRKRVSRPSGAPPTAGERNEFIVITILVAADAPFKLPPVTDLESLQTALKRLGSVRAGALQAVEILWTPQEEGDTLTQAELSRNYPLLNSL